MTIWTIKHHILRRNENSLCHVSIFITLVHKLHSNDLANFLGTLKEYSNYLTAVLLSHTSKVMLKILQSRLQRYVNWELSDVQAGFRKDRGTRDCQHSLDHRESKGIQKNASTSLTTLKPLTMWITTNCGKFLEIGIPDTLLVSWKTFMWVKKQQNWT